MKRLRIYLDTSAINFVYATDAPDFRAKTLDFFMDHAMNHDLFISNVVLLEIGRDPVPAHRNALMEVIDDHEITVLPAERRDAIERLSRLYIERGVIPRKKEEDAQHVAYATIYEMDLLLSWNFKHLANVNREAKILAVNAEAGYTAPLRLLSPLEVLDESDTEI